MERARLLRERRPNESYRIAFGDGWIQIRSGLHAILVPYPHHARRRLSSQRDLILPPCLRRTSPVPVSYLLLLRQLAQFHHYHQADVSVTAASGLSFNPTSVTAAAGDNVVFTFSSLHVCFFLSSNLLFWRAAEFLTSTCQTVTQSNFDSPCSRLSDGFDSGT
jgi:hypothetical protein